MNSRLLIASMLGGAALLVSISAFATCRINNDTKFSFTISSGNVSNQRVGSHTITTIASGNISAKSDDGQLIGGVCKDGDEVIIKEKDGKAYLAKK